AGLEELLELAPEARRIAPIGSRAALQDGEADRQVVLQREVLQRLQGIQGIERPEAVEAGITPRLPRPTPPVVHPHRAGGGLQTMLEAAGGLEARVHPEDEVAS